MTMMADQDNAARDVAERLGVSLSTLHTDVDGKGRPKPRAQLLTSSGPGREQVRTTMGAVA